MPDSSTEEILPGRIDRAVLDALYRRYNRPCFIHPDPLEFVYHYEDPADREITAFIASSLAYGRVAQIRKSVSAVLGLMGPSPFRFLTTKSAGTVKKALSGFKHRFTTGEELAALFGSLRGILKKYGSLEACFVSGLSPDDETVLNALAAFVERIRAPMPDAGGMLLPSPTGGSACKRLNLFLRWMVRSDSVDPGVWSGVAPRLLIVPLDTHMHRIGLHMGATRRRQADLRTALEITDAFRKIIPDDPVRYDFALTRPGIRSGME